MRVQQGDESALEELVAIEGKVIGHPGHAGGSQTGPAHTDNSREEQCTDVTVSYPVAPPSNSKAR